MVWQKGRKLSLEERTKLSEIRKKLFAEGKLKSWNKGKHWDEITKEKISESNKGRVSERKGKTYEEIYGKERALIEKQKRDHIKYTQRAKYWLGKHRDKKTLDAMRPSMFKKGQIPHNKGKKFTEEEKEKVRIIVKNLWKDPHYRKIQMAGQIKRIEKIKMLNQETKERIQEAKLKALFLRPTSLENQFIDLCKKHNLPFVYTGDGKLLINFRNPDFVDTEGRRLLIETANTVPFHHDPKFYEDDRIKRFNSKGFKTLVLWDTDFYEKPNSLRLHQDWEERVLKKVKEFTDHDWRN